MARDRPQYIMRSINSIFNQTFQNFNFIVSDNSATNEVQNIIVNNNIKDPRFTYIRRCQPFESGIDHINAIHHEVQTQYYIIFHDDDIMLPEMVGQLYETIKEDNKIVAVGGFAYTIKNGRKISSKIPNNKEIIDSPVTLISKYTSGGANAAFASYMYNKHLLTNFIEKKNGGKYSDCSFIVSLPQNGLVVHIPYPLMEITIHEGQDSQDHNFCEYLSLIKYLKRIAGKENKKGITRLRVFNIYNELVRRHKKDSIPLYSLRILRLLFTLSPTSFFLKYIIRMLHLYNK